MVVNFKMRHLNYFVKKHGILHEFSSHRTPQQNGHVERKNRHLLEMVRIIIHENNLPKYLWIEAVNTICYVRNRIYVRLIHNKTSYELFKVRKPTISYFHQFGCTCYILNNKLYMKKFDAKAQKLKEVWMNALKHIDCITLKPRWLKSQYILHLMTKSLTVKCHS